MYLSKKVHLLSGAIMLSALIRLAVTVFDGGIRMIINRTAHFAPDMLDTVLWNIQTACSFLKAFGILVVFYFSWKKIKKIRSVISDKDRDEIGRLQKEALGSHISTLPLDTVEQLILIWGVILGGAECVYYITSVVYRQFTSQLMLMAVGGAQYDSFVPLYNLSHGFKYLEMMTAIVLGVTITAIVLRDRYLNAVSGVLMIVFLLAFAVFQMKFISLSGRQIGIVWTSVIFHLTETVGLFILSVYLSKHYRGL